MAKDNKTLSEIKSADFSTYDKELVTQYMREGLPGIASIEESKIQRMFELYLSGKPYGQVARAVSMQKRIVLYLAYKFNWHEAKMQYLNEVQENLKERLLETKLVSQNFLNDLIIFWHTKIGNKVTRFLATGDEKFADNINPSDIDRYFKTLEALQKITAEPSKKKNSPAVGLNLGEGVTIKKMGNNKVEITPKEKSVSSMLKQFADIRREEEKKQNSINKSDIIEEDNKDLLENITEEGENNEI